MSNNQKKQITIFDFIFEIMRGTYLAFLFCTGFAGLLMVLAYKYTYVPSNVFLYLIAHPFFGLITLAVLVILFFRYLPRAFFIANRLQFSQSKTARVYNHNKNVLKSSFFQNSNIIVSFLTFNIILILSLLQTIDGLFWGRRLTSLNDLFNGKYTSFTDPGMWIWSLVYFIQILIIFFYLKYKYESPKQKPLIDKTMEIYNSPEAAQYRESKYGRYITVFLLSGFWIFLHQIALVLIRIFNQ
ncbi:hypothetical protein IPM65_06530 [Candidatus Roizmanbacteria bacterium]|nr:MAG: hypothetical protein IPM65_06530 [Candidatus Roizmanbacteria bacterium]